MRAIARVPHTCARTDTAAIEDVFVAASASMTYLPELYTEAETRAFVRDVLLPNNEVWVAEDAGHVIAWYRPAFPPCRAVADRRQRSPGRAASSLSARFPPVS